MPNPEVQKPRLSLTDGTVVYDCGDDRLWEIALDRIRVVGEFTTSSWGDDYFLVLVTDEGRWFEGSFYSENSAEFLLDLGEQVGAELKFGLCNSTELKSRVMWPTPIKDDPLFRFDNTAGTTLLERFRLFLSPRVDLCLSSEVIRHLGG